MMWGDGGLHWGWMVLVWVVVVGVVVWAVVRITATTARRGGTAQDILDERYARGEIDDEEYERRRRSLMR